MAPRTERSASRLFGNGFSRVVSAAMSYRGSPIRLFFAYSKTHPQTSASSSFQASTGTIFRWRGLCLPEDRQAGLDQILFDCTESLAHCARGCRARQPEFLCIAVHAFGNVEKIFAHAFLPIKRAQYPTCLDTAPCSKTFCPRLRTRILFRR